MGCMKVTWIYRCLIPIPFMGLVYLPTLTWMVDLYGTCIGKYTSPMDAVEICLLYTCKTAIHLSSQIFTLVEQFNIQEEYSNIGAFTQKQVLETYIFTIPKSVPLDAVYTYILLVMLSLPVVPVTFFGLQALIFTFWLVFFGNSQMYHLRLRFFLLMRTHKLLRVLDIHCWWKKSQPTSWDG